MANLYYAAKYKNKIINLLLENQDFITLINPTPNEGEESDIVDVHVFDYNFITNTTTDEKTFVFVEADIDTIRQNIFTDFNLCVYVFTAKELVRLTSETVPTVEQVKEMGYFADTYANRIDVLCDIVDRVLNGNEKMQGIGTIEPAQKEYCTIYTPNSKYYGKCLKYHITNYNEAGDDYGS